MIPIDEIIIDETRHVWLITPYLGDWSGMLSLEEALVAKGGQLPVLEATRAITHIRAALDSSQTLGVALPNLTIDQLILCPRGTLAVELPGVAEILESPGEASTPMRWVQAERLIARLGAHLLTGVPNATAETIRSVFPRRKQRGVVRWVCETL